MGRARAATHGATSQGARARSTVDASVGSTNEFACGLPISASAFARVTDAWTDLAFAEENRQLVEDGKPPRFSIGDIVDFRLRYKYQSTDTMVPVIAAATSAGWKENETPTPEQVEAAARALHELDVSDHERARLDEPEWEQHREEYERTVGAALAAASGEASDTALSSWVYCAQHLTPHASGWCTVSNQQKLRLNAITRDEAYTEAKQLGLRFANDPPPASY